MSLFCFSFCRQGWRDNSCCEDAKGERHRGRKEWFNFRAPGAYRFYDFSFGVGLIRFEWETKQVWWIPFTLENTSPSLQQSVSFTFQLIVILFNFEQVEDQKQIVYLKNPEEYYIWESLKRKRKFKNSLGLGKFNRSIESSLFLQELPSALAGIPNLTKQC